MTILQIILIVALALLITACAARAQGQSLPQENSQKAEQKPQITEQQIRKMSSEEIQKALENLQNTSAPPSKIGAMCYKVSDSPDFLEYTCPIDGEKTTYSLESSSYSKLINRTKLKNLIREVQLLVDDISITLDERKMCSTCFPDLKDNERNIILIIKYTNNRIVRTDNVIPDDLRYLIGFFSNSLSYKTSNGGEEPLKNIENRLRQLLGE